MSGGVTFPTFSFLPWDSSMYLPVFDKIIHDFFDPCIFGWTHEKIQKQNDKIRKSWNKKRTQHTHGAMMDAEPHHFFTRTFLSSILLISHSLSSPFILILFCLFFFHLLFNSFPLSHTVSFNFPQGLSSMYRFISIHVCRH